MARSYRRRRSFKGRRRSSGKRKRYTTIGRGGYRM